MKTDDPQHKPNKTDAGNGSYGICRVIDASSSPSPDPRRSANMHTTTRNHRKSEAGFMSVAFVELQVIAFVLCLLGAIVFGNGPVRITALIVFSGIGAGIYWLGRRVRFHVGDQVRIKFGPHQGSVGTIVGHMPGGYGVRVAVKLGGQTETIDFHGGYEVERDTILET